MAGDWRLHFLQDFENIYVALEGSGIKKKKQPLAKGYLSGKTLTFITVF